MSKTIFHFLHELVIFGRNVTGCMNSPYPTYRRLSVTGTSINQTIFIFLIAVSYFIFVAMVRNGLKNPLLLTVKFNSLIIASGLGFITIVFMIYGLGKKFGGKGTIQRVYLLWTFSLLPTIVWFWTTSILYIVLPPPRTLSISGKFFSIVFVAFSLALFYWKAILYYLTLRFALKMDLFRIVIVSSIIIPVIIVYSIFMYKLGIFRVPFI